MTKYRYDVTITVHGEVDTDELGPFENEDDERDCADELAGEQALEDVRFGGANVDFYVDSLERVG